jgi:hypothetical protein
VLSVYPETNTKSLKAKKLQTRHFLEMGDLADDSSSSTMDFEGHDSSSGMNTPVTESPADSSLVGEHMLTANMGISQFVDCSDEATAMMIDIFSRDHIIAAPGHISALGNTQSKYQDSADTMIITKRTHDTFHYFFVDADLLTRNSTVFRDELKVKRGQLRGPDWCVRIRLPDCVNVTGFEFVLDILYCKFAHIPLPPVDDNTLRRHPEYPTLRDQVFAITQITNRFGLTQLLRPWAPTWIDYFRKCAARGCRGMDGPGDWQPLWISWELGAEDILEKLALELLMDTGMGRDGRLGRWHFSIWEPLHGMPLPDGLAGIPGYIFQASIVEHQRTNTVADQIATPGRSGGPDDETLLGTRRPFTRDPGRQV